MIARRKYTEILLDELLKLQPEPRSKVIRAPRFQRADLLDLILDKSEKTAAGDPPEASRLAALAVELGIAIRASVEDPPGGNRLVKALLLLGSTHRLGGDRNMAERAFGSAAYLLTRGSTPFERARVCRGIGLLRWEEGRLDEAAALLLHASRLYQESAELPEEGACLALLGLLHAQEDETERALEPLSRASSILGGQPTVARGAYPAGARALPR
jgi:tetratricopeptide (TPR) repeat protein